MSRRGKHEGSIYQREDGRWVGVAHLGYKDGKRKRKYIYGKTRAEVARKLNKTLEQQQQGLPVVDERQTVAQFLTHWLEDIGRPSLRPRTFSSYQMIITHHLIPVLGRIRLAKLSPQDVQTYMNEKRESGLSPRTVTYHRAVLRKALNDGLRWGVVVRNVAALARPPKRVKPERRYLTPEEARSFLSAVAGHRLEALFTVALAVGLRQGEALGLRWEDVDLEKGIISTRVQLQRIDGHLRLVDLKSETSHRSIALPEVALHALQDHRRRQLEERLAEGPRWEDHGLVFTTGLGRPLDPRNITTQFHRLRDAAGLPWLTFHGLRHGFGSLLAAQGVHPRVAMELMGHSQIGLTMEIYTHVAPELAHEAASKIDDILKKRS